MEKRFEDLAEASGVDLANGGGFEKLRQFQEKFRTICLLCLIV